MSSRIYNLVRGIESEMRVFSDQILQALDNNAFSAREEMFRAHVCNKLGDIATDCGKERVKVRNLSYKCTIALTWLNPALSFQVPLG